MAPTQALDHHRRADSERSARSLSSHRVASAAVLFVLIIAISPYSTAGEGVRDIQSDTTSTWSKSAAADEIKHDINAFLERYNKRFSKLEVTLEQFIADRQKEGGIRKLAKWGKAMGLLVKFLPDKAIPKKIRRQIDEAAHDLGTMLNSASLTSHSFVENTTMRGWPMYRQPYCKYPVYEAYNFGHIGQAIAAAARMSADKGDYEDAVDLLTPVLGGMYDNFLTDDPEKTKLDSQGRLTLVPPQSSPERVERYLEVDDYKICLEQPEMYNHGTSPARAAMEVMEVIDLIQEGNGWDRKVSWPLSECSLEECRKKLGEYIENNGIWMKSAFDQPQSVTGEYPGLDKYPGDNGTSWYTWRYQDVSNCPDGPVYPVDRTAEFVDRPQDIQHGKEEMAFIHEYMEWATRTGTSDVFSMEDIRRLIVTFLNRVVYDYSAASDNNLFACDVEGSITGFSCSGSSRGIERRSQGSANWLVLAYAAKKHGTAWDSAHWDEPESRSLRCDVYRMVRLVLPLVLPGSDRFDANNFEKISSDWFAEIAMAKYYFYNYDYGIEEACP